jgi:hypothetical protein
MTQDRKEGNRVWLGIWDDKQRKIVPGIYGTILSIFPTRDYSVNYKIQLDNGEIINKASHMVYSD